MNVMIASGLYTVHCVSHCLLYIVPWPLPSAVFETGEMVVVRETQVVRDGQVDGIVLMQWNVVVPLGCPL